MKHPPPHVSQIEQTCFLVICRDGQNAGELRHKLLDGHLKHVETYWDRYITAGPIREPGEHPLIGSAFLVLADTLDEAKKLMNDDPYISSGMYDSIEYKEFSNSIGLFLGGKIWDRPDTIRHRASGGPTANSKEEI